MAKPTSKQQSWQRPRLDVAPAPHVAAEILWAQGAAAEEAYDFEAARDAYRQAAAAASQAAALDYATRYAEFLVERFGQFDEVAAWLDDAAFAAPAAADAHGHTLARLLARAAHETHHARAAEIDERAAAAGDGAALLRAVERQAATGAVEMARQRLEHASGTLPPDGQRLLQQLRQEAQRAVQTALAPAEAALLAGDLTAAAHGLQACQTVWGHTPPYHAIAQRLQEVGRATTAEVEAAQLEEAKARAALKALPNRP